MLVNLTINFWAETISVVIWSILASLLFKLLLDINTTLSYLSSKDVRMNSSEYEYKIYHVIYLTFPYIYVDSLWNNYCKNLPVNFNAVIVVVCRFWFVWEFVKFMLHVTQKINKTLKSGHMSRHMVSKNLFLQLNNSSFLIFWIMILV